MEGRTEGVFEEVAAAYVAGRCGTGAIDLKDPRVIEAFVRQGQEKFGPNMDKFKRKVVLHRVQKVLGFFKQVSPKTLLDIGTGRGTFLWPCMDQFPDLQVTAVDNDDIRARDLGYIEAGGCKRLKGCKLDATDMYGVADKAFEVVTALEVLEHIPDFEVAIEEACRAASQWVVASVPSKADDNPGHIHLLTQGDLRSAFKRFGAQKVRTEYVRGHLVLFARMT